MENNESLLREWIDKAEAYCARAEHCAADVKRKLYEWSAPMELADDIIDRLYERDFLNDKRFCMAYVHDKVAYQSWGRLKIQAGLRALQLPEKYISQALNEIDEEQYTHNLRNLSRQRASDPDDKRTRFLMQRGFTFDEIRHTKC
ncbi:MAG: RecX family transcriptional regulator [Paludibacteraceae bacterium]|nr:RecX family transcriptional regulator [Paludibacteraceae bacterium]